MSSTMSPVLLYRIILLVATLLLSMTTLVACQSSSPSSSTPYQITPVQEINTDFYAYGTAYDKKRNLLFLATGDLDAGGQLAIYQTDGFKTSLVSRVPTNYSILAEYCPEKQILYLGHGTYFKAMKGGLEILNVSDIDNVTSLAYIPYELSVLGLSLHETSQRLFVSLGRDNILVSDFDRPNGTLLVYNVRDSNEPKLLHSQIVVHGIAYSISFFNSDLIFLGTGVFPFNTGAVYILNFTTFETLNKMEFPRLPFSVKTDSARKLLHVASGAIGNGLGGKFMTFNLSEPNMTHPREIFTYSSPNPLIKMCLGLNSTFAFITSDKTLIALNLVTGLAVPIGGLPFAFGLVFSDVNYLLYVAAGPTTNTYAALSIQRNEISYWAVNKTVAIANETFDAFMFSKGDIFFFIRGNVSNVLNQSDRANCTIVISRASYGTSSGPVFEQIGEIKTNSTILSLHYDEVTQNLYVGTVGCFLRFALVFDQVTGFLSSSNVTFRSVTLDGNVMKIIPFDENTLIFGFAIDLLFEQTGFVLFIDKHTMLQRGSKLNTSYVIDLKINDDRTLLFVLQSDTFIRYILGVYTINHTASSSGNFTVHFKAYLSQTTLQAVAITKKGDLFIAAARQFGADSTLLAICNTSIYNKTTKLYNRAVSVFVGQPIVDIFMDEEANALFVLVQESLLIYSIFNRTNPILKATQELPVSPTSSAADPPCTRLLRSTRKTGDPGLSYVFIVCGREEKMIVVETGAHFLISSVGSPLTGTVADISAAFVGEESKMQFYIFSNQGALLSDLHFSLSNVTLIDHLGSIVPWGGSVNFVLKQMKLIITPDVRFTNTFLTFQMRIQNDVVCAFIGVRPSLTVDISPKNIQRPFNIRSLRQQLSVFVKVPITSASSENGDGEETTPSSDIGQFIPTNFGTAFSAIINTTLETTGQLNSMNDLLNKVRFLPGTKYSKNAPFQMTINDQLNYPQTLQVPAGLFKLLQPPHQAVHFDTPIQRKVYDYLDIVVPTGLFEDSYGLPLQYSIVHDHDNNFVFEQNSMSITGTVPLQYLGRTFSIIINATNGYLWSSAAINITVPEEQRPASFDDVVLVNCHPEETTSFYIDPAIFNISAEKVSQFLLVPIADDDDDSDDLGDFFDKSKNEKKERVEESLPSWLSFDTVKGRIITNPGSSALRLYIFPMAHFYNVSIVDIYNRTAHGKMNIFIQHSVLQVLLILVTTFSSVVTVVGFYTKRHETRALLSGSSLILTSATELNALIESGKVEYFKCFAVDRKDEWKRIKRLNYYVFMALNYRELQESAALFNKKTGSLSTENCLDLGLKDHEDIAVVMRDFNQWYTGVVIFKNDGNRYVIYPAEKDEAICCCCSEDKNHSSTVVTAPPPASVYASLLDEHQQQDSRIDVGKVESTRNSGNANSVMIHRDPHSSRRHLQQDENDDEAAEKVVGVGPQKTSTSNMSTKLSPRPM